MDIYSSSPEGSARRRARGAGYVLAIVAAVGAIVITLLVASPDPRVFLLLALAAVVIVRVQVGPRPALLCMMLCAVAAVALTAARPEPLPLAKEAFLGWIASFVVFSLPLVGGVEAYRQRMQTLRGPRAERVIGHSFNTELPSNEHQSADSSAVADLAADLQRRLDERLRADARLAAEHSVTRTLAHADDFESAVPNILRAICENLGFEIGEMWLHDEPSGALRCCAIVSANANERFQEFERVSRAMSFAMGEGLPGRVWQTRTPSWIPQLHDDANFPRAQVATRVGLQSGCAFPIISGLKCFGVMEFFTSCSVPQDQDVMNSMAVVGSEIGQFILRKQAEKDLHEKHLELQSVNVELRAIQDELRQQNENLIGARNALEAERQRYVELFQLAPDGYIVTDLDGVILEANHSAALQLNAQQQTLVGENAFEYIDLTQLDDVATRIQALRNGNVSRQALEFRMMPFDAEPIETAVTLALMRDSAGRAVGLRWLIRDVGHWRQIERELARHQEHLEELIESRTIELESTHERLRVTERLASIGTLATGLGHDIGNFALPMLCRLETLAAQPLPEQVLAEIDRIKNSVIGLRNLSKGLSLFALDPEDAEAAPRSTSIDTWWADAGPLLRKAVPKTVELQCQFESPLPLVAIAPHQLTQAVRNLLTNAGEASRASDVVTLWVKQSANPRVVELGVRDQGVGMTDEVRQHALEPFFTTKKRSLSTGLGLSMVHAVVKSVGGTVEIESKPSVGTTVTLGLPAVIEAEEHAGTSRIQSGAAISLTDDRIASYAITLLKSANIPVCELVQSNSVPEEEMLWITEPMEERFESIRQFLASRQGRRVILVGQPSDQWKQAGVVVVEGSHRAMHQALQDAVLELF